MSNDLIAQGNDVPAIADDFLLQVADQAEKRIDAVMKIKRVSLKVTNARDWTDQNGNPYLQVSGSEKIANLFNISWRIDEPIYDEEADGHFTWTYRGAFSLGGRNIDAIGTRSSKDQFFNKYEYVKTEGKPDQRVLMPLSAIDKGDVKKAAFTNLLGNGITRILGIRNLTWDDLKEYAGITREQVTSIQYKKDGKPPLGKPQEKKAETPKEQDATPIIQVAEVKPRAGKGPYRIMDTQGTAYNTFSDTFAEEATKAVDSGASIKIAYTKGKFGNDITALEVVVAQQEAFKG